MLGTMLKGATAGVKKQFIAVAHETTPFITAYPWSGSGFGTKFSNPGTLPTGFGSDVAFSPFGDAIAVAHSTSPFITAYPWSSSGFGTKFANPGTLTAGDGLGVAFSPSGDAIAVTSSSSPFINAYPWSSSGFGAKFANPGTLPAGVGNGVAFSPAGDAIAVAHGGAASPAAITNPLAVYQWSSSGFGARFSGGSLARDTVGRAAAFNPSGDAVAVAYSNSSPYIAAYRWSSSGFGAKFANPGTLPAGDAYGVAFTEI